MGKNREYLGSEGRYIKKLVAKELWLQVRGAALLAGKKLGVWIEEAFREKMSRERR